MSLTRFEKYKDVKLNASKQTKTLLTHINYINHSEKNDPISKEVLSVAEDKIQKDLEQTLYELELFKASNNL